MVPKTRGDGSFLIAFFLEERAKYIIGKFVRLGKAIDAFADPKIEPTIADVFGEVVFLNEIFGSVG